MSESNNNIPMRITQLEEATAYEDGMFFAVAKAGSGTKKIDANISSKALNYTKESVLPYNCVEMLPLSGLKAGSSAGFVFTPSKDGRKITSSGTLSGNAIYNIYYGNINNSVFEAGGKYKVLYTAPAKAYFQIICDDTVLLNTESFDIPKEITIPANTSTLAIRLFIDSTSQAGDYEISFVNYREKDYIENSLLSEDDFYKDVKAFVGYESDNLFENIGVTNGKYVASFNGKLYDNADFSATDFFKIFYGAKYKLSYKAASSQIAYYDENFNFVSGSLTSNYIFEVPNNSIIKYARWCGETSHLSEWGLYIEPLTTSKIKVITTTEGILEGIIDAYSKGFTKIVVRSGTYDIIAEYKSKYGNDYFSNYAIDYNNWTNGRYDAGIWLDNVDITFESGAVVNCKYEGGNTNIYTYWSAFAVGQNVRIDGLVLDAENIRYGVHPDFHPLNEGEYLIIENCDLHQYRTLPQGSTDNQAVGIGLGKYTKLKIKNCIFRSDTSGMVLRIHNNSSSDAVSTIIIDNCYIVGGGYIRLNSYSTSEKQTRALVSNCSWEKAVVVGKETQESNDNITLYAWNNELRTQ